MDIREYVDASQLRDLERHLDLVMAANETTNITRITSREEAYILHIEDSLVGLPELNEAPSGRYGDMGSGAGFPGIPLALVSGRETVLIESIGKKASALETFLSDLGISGTVSVYNGRVEELALSEPHSFAAITARALSQLPSLMELASPLLMMGGRLICYKAHVGEEEFTHARSIEKKTGLALVSDRDLYLSDGETYRRIIVFEKRKEPTVTLPRRNGMAQKRPLKA